MPRKAVSSHDMTFNWINNVTASPNASLQIETFFHPLPIQIRSRCLSEHTRISRSPENTMKNVANLVEILISVREIQSFFSSNTFAGKVVAKLSTLWRGKRVWSFVDSSSQRSNFRVIYYTFKVSCLARRKSKTLIGKCVWMISAIFASNSHEVKLVFIAFIDKCFNINYQQNNLRHRAFSHHPPSHANGKDKISDFSD